MPFSFPSWKAAWKKNQTGFLRPPVLREPRCRTRQAAESLRPACGGGCGAAPSRLAPPASRRPGRRGPQAPSPPRKPDPVGRSDGRQGSCGRKCDVRRGRRLQAAGCRLGAGIPSRLRGPRRAGPFRELSRARSAGPPRWGSEAEPPRLGPGGGVAPGAAAATQTGRASAGGSSGLLKKEIHLDVA